MDPVIRELLEARLAVALERHEQLNGHLVSLSRQTEDTVAEHSRNGAYIHAMRIALENADE